MWILSQIQRGIKLCHEVQYKAQFIFKKGLKKSSTLLSMKRSYLTNSPFLTTTIGLSFRPGKIYVTILLGSLILLSYRGAPHLHSLLWLEDSNGVAPSTFWTVDDMKVSGLPDDLQNIFEKYAETKTSGSDINDKSSTFPDMDCEQITNAEKLEERKQKISEFASKIVFGSIDDAKCKDHRKFDHNDTEVISCKKCQIIKKRVETFNCHGCTFSCHKKKKYVVINKNEGHGRLDKIVDNQNQMELPTCRFNVPFFPLDETIFLQGLSKDLPEEELKKKKYDLRKIRKYLLRQSYGHKEDSLSWSKLRSLNFWQFLYEVGMFEDEKSFEQYTEAEMQRAKTRYLNALATSIRGSGSIFLRRGTKDIFFNNFNPNIMLLHGANHDLQVVVDQYAVAQYIVGYVTKNEAGMSQLLKNINDNAENLSKMELLNSLASVLDKHREVSIQEATYRMMSFPMVKSSVKIKYVSTCHPNFRDGLLKGNIEDIDETNESIFHDSPVTYYENRPTNKTEVDYDAEDEEDGNEFDDEEKKEGFWKNQTFSEFLSCHDVVYAKQRPQHCHKLRKRNVFIRKRTKQAVLRYYLRYDDIEEYCRGLLILFFPYRKEMVEVHEKDVIDLVKDNYKSIIAIKAQFEAHKVMTDMINDVQKRYDEKLADSETEEDSNDNTNKEEFLGTTTDHEIHDFESWAKAQAEKQLKSVKEYTNVQDVSALRKSIIDLNSQQRLIFDDIMEREFANQTAMEIEPYHIFISGEAGTGKSYLMRVLMEAIKRLNVKPGKELDKPSIISMAPTANAAYILKDAKTIDSALCFNRQRNYVKLSAAKEASLKFLYDDVSVIIMDEVSMVGSVKLTKINFRMQDLSHGHNKRKFMGGRSSLLTGELLISGGSSNLV